MDITHLPSHEHIVVRHVTPDQPLQWLRMGWQDLRRAPADSLFYGAAFVVMGFLLNLYFDFAPQFMLTLATLFLLAGPFLAIGLYDIARQLESARHGPMLMHSITAWRSNLPGFTLFAALLAVLVFGWFRVSLLMFALFFEGSVPSLDQLVVSAFTTENLPFLLAYFGTGLFFAAAVFALSVCAIPMMLDKDVDTITAMVMSVRAVYRNLLTMLVWAAMIVFLTAIGFATWLIGLLIIMPLIGLSSWHAYRALINFER
ncbi:DUF2189 domain-containing protein [Vogesella fluminis]|uniref:Cytochrome b6 n=1 Tax=Vogesella fluminis TaxID=1069161 RepID=A0ABQ3HCA8_9NEIS|nr:DUF2189 domain-containing protein [Vogesella fluminis]GHD77980.1 cytochrome b6 [Vogesella fluminis]